MAESTIPTKEKIEMESIRRKEIISDYIDEYQEPPKYQKAL